MKLIVGPNYKTAVLFTLFFAFSNIGFSQEATKDSDFKNWKEVEVKPEFPGEMMGFYKFVANSFNIPEEATKNKVSGKVYVKFLIEKDGSLSNYEILNDLGYGIGDEAIRILKLSPKWKPGTINNKPVRVMHSLPITIHTPQE